MWFRLDLKPMEKKDKKRKRRHREWCWRKIQGTSWRNKDKVSSDETFELLKKKKDHSSKA